MSSTLPADIMRLPRNACGKLRECENFLPPSPVEAAYIVYSTADEDTRITALNGLQSLGANLVTGKDNRGIDTTFAVFPNDLQVVCNANPRGGVPVKVIAFPVLPQDRRLRDKLGFVRLVCTNPHKHRTDSPINVFRDANQEPVFEIVYGDEAPCFQAAA